MSEQLRTAIKDLLDHYRLEDYGIDVATDAVESDESYRGSKYDHPKAVRFAEIVEILKESVK